MTLLAILLVLFLEQQHVLPVQRWVREPMQSIAVRLNEKFNDGSRAHGILAWLLIVGLPTLAVIGLHGLLLMYQPVLAFVFGVAMLYVTLGFRQFSHFFTEIQTALQADELDTARRLLASWRGRNSDRLRPREVARLAIEEGLVSSHRHVFAPMFWFVILGPAGAVLYRLSHTLDSVWVDPVEPHAELHGEPRDGSNDGTLNPFGQFARRAFVAIDWLPVRVTAAAFAVVGDFEDAVQCWRVQATRWPEPGAGILLASGAGALGLKLGMPVRGGDGVSDPEDRPEMGLGEEADADFMQSTIGLVWRSLVFFLAVLALVWVSGWIGG